MARRSYGSRSGERDADPRAAAGRRVVHVHRRAVALGDIAHDREAQAASFRRLAVAAAEALEDAAALVGRDAGAVVDHLEDGTRSLAPRPDEHVLRAVA